MNNSSKRSPYDFYPTPKDAFDRLWQADKTNWQNAGYILEPAAGDGALIKYIKDNINQEHLSKIFIKAVELDKNGHEDKLEKCGANYIEYVDYLTHKEDIKPDIVITNPPFSLAQEFIEHTLGVIKPERTIMLLRLNFLASQKRKAFWDKYTPSRIYVLSKRPSFTGKGTDSQDYAWFIWDNNKYEKQILVI